MSSTRENLLMPVQCKARNQVTTVRAGHMRRGNRRAWGAAGLRHGKSFMVEAGLGGGSLLSLTLSGEVQVAGGIFDARTIAEAIFQAGRAREFARGPKWKARYWHMIGKCTLMATYSFPISQRAYQQLMNKLKSRFI